MLKVLAVVALLASGPGVGAASASPPPQAESSWAATTPADHFWDANFILQTRLEEAEESKGEPPRISDPAVAALLRTAFDREMLRPGVLGDWKQTTFACEFALNTVIGYLTLGAKVERRVLEPVVEQNMARYQDEATPGLVFGVHCAAVNATYAAEMVRASSPDDLSDTFRQGVERMQSGAVRMVSGALRMQESGALKPANRVLLMEAHAQTAAVIAGMLRESERKALLGQIDAFAVRAAPEVRVQFATLRAAYSRTECEGLCLIQPRSL